MQTQNRLLEDLARVASSAMGVAANMRGEVEARLREQFERILRDMDLVTREEFEAIKAVAVKAREEQEILAARLATLEAKAAGKAAKKTKKSEKPSD
jgi:BMFP domain-containing protein YqiC